MALYLSNRDGNGKTSEEGHYKFQVNAYTGNVLGTGLQVTQQTTPALGVKVSAGQYRIPTGTGAGAYAYTGWSDADTNVAITTADPANPRISAIVIYVDKGAATSASPPNNPGIAKFMSVNGTAGAVPVAPNDATIQSAVGAANPFIRLANVTVAAAGTTVLNAAISDQRVFVTAATDIINTASILDSAVTTNKINNLAVTEGKHADLSATTRKVKPTYVQFAGNNGASRQSVPTANTTYVVTGTSFNYTSGATAEVLFVKGHVMSSFTAGGNQSFLTVNGTQIGRSFYTDYTGWISKWCEGWYEIPAATTVTIDYRVRTAGTGGGSLCNASTDMTGTPNFGVQMYMVAWGKA